MPAQKGKDLLLKIDDGAAGFVTVAGLRTRQLAFNAETVDVTHSESAGRWRELLAGAGVRRAGITGAMRLVLGLRRFAIRAASDPDGRRRELVCRVEEISS